MKEIIKSSHAPAPIGPYNQGIKFGNMLFLSGQVALDAQTGNMMNSSLEEETTKVLDNIDAVLKESGVDFDHVVKSTIYLTNMEDFGVINKIYGDRFTKDYPARETVEVSRLPKDARIEISIIAAL
jgi:2-iminobutanoate/2-iminopropanoate deaminase